jgi:hypothetical protein
MGAADESFGLLDLSNTLTSDLRNPSLRFAKFLGVILGVRIEFGPFFELGSRGNDVVVG